MKSLHRPDLYQWSRFDEARNVDFHGTLWVRPGGNVLIDLRNVYDRAEAEEAGFAYSGIGRGRLERGPHLKIVQNGGDAKAAR